MSIHPVGIAYSEAKEFPEMLSTVTDPNLEVFQVTTNLDGMAGRGGFFTPDSKRFIFMRQWGKQSQFTLAEVEDGFKLRNVAAVEEQPKAPVVSRDSRYMYYFADESGASKPRVLFKRLALDTFKTDVVTVFDSPVAGIGRRPRGGVGGGASLRADGKMILGGFNFVGSDGENHFAPVLVSPETGSIRGFEWEPYSWRVGGTYFQGTDAAHLGHIFMVRCHRSQHWDEKGTYSEKWYSDVRIGTLHIVNEEGAVVATVPIGGKGEGVDHPYWRGGRYEIVTHTSDFNTAPHWRGIILCAQPMACKTEYMYKGKEIPGRKRRYELTRHIRRPDVCHMSWDPSGKRVVCDTEGWHGRGSPCLQGPSAYLYIGTVVEKRGEDLSAVASAKEDPYLVPKYLLHPHSSWNSAYTENCPILAPNGKTVFFNSDWCCKFGEPQLFAVRGFEFPKG